MAKAKDKPKRGPGRPRSTPKPEGLDRTACAHHFGVNVKRVDRWLRDGVPVTRHNGRVYFDVNATAEWLEDNQQREPSQAAVLHPSDPRFAEKEAAAGVKLYEHGLEVGYFVTIDSMSERVSNDFANLNSALNTLPAIVGELRNLNSENAERILAGALAHVLSEFKSDHPKHFPEPREIIYDDSDEGEFEERSYMPVLSSGPQAAIARMNAQRHLAELKRLESSCVTVFDAQAMARKKCDAIRARLREVPKRVATWLAPEGNPMEYVKAAINFELDTAKIDLGGRYPSPPEDLNEDNPEHKAILEVFANMKPVPPVRLDSDDGYEDDDCDGIGEFEDSESEAAFEDA